MAVVDSHHQFRFAAMMLAPWEEADEPDENARRYWKLWLTPITVEWLRPAESYSLSAEQRELLARAKGEFLANVPDGCGEPTAAQLAAAARAYRAIYLTLEDARFDPPTQLAARLLRAILREPRYARWFVGVDFTAGHDWTGDPAVHAWLIVAEETPDDEQFLKEWTGLRHGLQRELQRRGLPDRYAYLRLRTAEDQRELLAGELE
jgi:hypothetical protein